MYKLIISITFLTSICFAGFLPEKIYLVTEHAVSPDHETTFCKLTLVPDQGSLERKNAILSFSAGQGEFTPLEQPEYCKIPATAKSVQFELPELDPRLIATLPATATFFDGNHNKIEEIAIRCSNSRATNNNYKWFSCYDQKGMSFTSFKVLYER